TTRTATSGSDLSRSCNCASACSACLRRSPISMLGESSTTTMATSFCGAHRATGRTPAAPAPRARTPRAPITAASARTPRSSPRWRATRSLTEALQNRRDMHLIGFVIPGQRVHHEVDAEAELHFALALAAGHDRIPRHVVAVDRPGAGPVVAAHDDGRNAVIDAVVRRFDPDAAIGPAPGKFLHQVEALGQNMVRWHRHERRNRQAGGETSQIFLG